MNLQQFANACMSEAVRARAARDPRPSLSFGIDGCYGSPNLPGPNVPTPRLLPIYDQSATVKPAPARASRSPHRLRML